MVKSPFVHWLFTATFIFSVWLNTVHWYEHDDDHSKEECEICFVLSKVSDQFLIGYGFINFISFAQILEDFTAKSYLLSSFLYIFPRAPPYIDVIV